jgi:hypothetical protein
MCACPAATLCGCGVRSREGNSAISRKGLEIKFQQRIQFLVLSVKLDQ